jgi:hypothetical protein
MPYNPIKFTKRKNKSSEEKIDNWPILKNIIWYIIHILNYFSSDLFIII